MAAWNPPATEEKKRTDLGCILEVEPTGALTMEMMGEGQGVGKGKGGVKEASEAGACSLPKHHR